MQGDLVEKDFNIVDEAGGAGRSIIKSYPATVTNSTLQIRFYWAGRGTTAVPVQGVYGPLISAISVEPGKLYASGLLFLLFMVREENIFSPFPLFILRYTSIIVEEIDSDDLILFHEG